MPGPGRAPRVPVNEGEEEEMATATNEPGARPARTRPHLSVDERVARGRAARAESPRRRHADWEPAGDRRDPVEVLEEQAATRVPELVPIRYGRMLTSPFAFYRGGAALMAADLASTPTSGVRVQLCGDAHLSNFGFFASPERALVFSVNDFDESLPGPWEWDVKRLAASFAIATRQQGEREDVRRSLVAGTVGAYRRAMRDFALMRDVEVWYAKADAEMIQRRLAAAATGDAKRFEKDIAKARAKDAVRALERLTHRVDGELRIISDAPLIVPIEELAEGRGRDDIEAGVAAIVSAYRRTLQRDRRRLLDGYRYVHLARKVVGVGSVGTRAWIVLLVGRDELDPLVLQAKEAQPSVLEPYAGRSEISNQGQRVVEGQRLMQAASDIFLGWCRVSGATLDGRSRDFHVRQLWDWKRSADVERMTPRMMAMYGELCGWTLARAHARSGDRIAIASYLGNGDGFDRALATFAEYYADQNERDYAAVEAAVASGRLTATTGL
jgi:uncharacterized protein (DUF2252 family)